MQFIYMLQINVAINSLYRAYRFVFLLRADRFLWSLWNEPQHIT